MAAFLTLAELRLHVLRVRAQEGHEGATIRVRARAVNVSGPKAYLAVVATPTRWAFCFADTLYRPAEQVWIYRPDNDGYLTLDLSAFNPDGQPSFYAYTPETGGLAEVKVGIHTSSEFHIVMPTSTMR